MSLSHIQQRSEQSEVYKRTMASCQTSLASFFLTPTWDTLKSRLVTMHVPITPSFITCRICEEPYMGHYFETTKSIVLCANNLKDKDFNSTLTHELIHAYDDARMKVNYEDPDHVACGEVRAVNLSKECKEEKWRWFSRKPDYNTCVFTRAKNNVHGNPHLKISEREAEEAVQRVWDICITDYQPLAPEKISAPYKQ